MTKEQNVLDKLTNSKILGIVDAFNGVIRPKEVKQKEVLRIEMQDAIALDNQDERFEFKKDELLKKIDEMNEDEVNELFDYIDKFWEKNRAWKGDIKSYMSKLGKKGGKKSGEQRKGNSEYMRELAKKRWDKEKGAGE